jgi:hypothetical protein
VAIDCPATPATADWILKETALKREKLSMSNDPINCLPDSLRIGPFDVRIEKHEKLCDEDTWGTYNGASLLMQFQSGQPSNPFAADTVLHEINHAIYRIFALRDSDDEERIVTVMATGMIQVLRDNPALLIWLKDTLEQSVQAVPR